MYDKINFVVQIGWNRVKKILAPCVGEFCFNLPYSYRDIHVACARETLRSLAIQIKEVAMTSNTRWRLGGL